MFMERVISRRASRVSSSSCVWWRGVSKNTGVGICKGMDSNGCVCCIYIVVMFCFGVA